MPTVDLPGMRSISTDSACIARHRSSARPVIFEYFTPASGLNSKVVTTGPGWIWTTLPSTENSRHFSSSRRAPSISSRSSILRSVFGASSSASGGSAYSPLRRSAGAFAAGSGSDSGSGGDGIATFGGFGGANDFGPPIAAAAAAGAVVARGGDLAALAGGRAARRVDRAAAAGALISGGGAPFFVCLAITSRRCFARRRSSRHSLNQSAPRADAARDQPADRRRTGGRTRTAST